MGLASMKTFVVLQLLLLVLGSVNAALLAKPLIKAHPPVPPPMPHPHHIHHGHLKHVPAHAPSYHHHHHLAYPPTHHHYPAYPPSHPPSQPSHHTPSNRKFVAVEGVVYSKSCKYSGVDTLTGATAMIGADVKLLCNNKKYSSITLGKTDSHGYFYIEAPKTVTTYGARRCKVYLVSSLLKMTNLNNGATGATLKYEKTEKTTALYSVGPFAYEPPKC